MHIASLVFGTSIIAVALGLESHRRRQDPVLATTTDLDRSYKIRRRRGRLLTNALVGVIGALAGIAGLSGTGHVWMVMWALIPIVLVMVVLLAFGDAIRTDRYLRAKLPELREQTLGTSGLFAEGSVGRSVGPGVEGPENRS